MILYSPLGVPVQLVLLRFTSVEPSTQDDVSATLFPSMESVPYCSVSMNHFPSGIAAPSTPRGPAQESPRDMYTNYRTTGTGHHWLQLGQVLHQPQVTQPILTDSQLGYQCMSFIGSYFPLCSSDTQWRSVCLMAYTLYKIIYTYFYRLIWMCVCVIIDQWPRRRILSLLKPLVVAAFIDCSGCTDTVWIDMTCHKCRSVIILFWFLSFCMI